MCVPETAVVCVLSLRWLVTCNILLNIKFSFTIVKLHRILFEVVLVFGSSGSHVSDR